MPKRVSQVPHIDTKRLSKLDKMLWASLLDMLEKKQSKQFGAPIYSNSKRSYPGEAEAKSVVRYLESVPQPSKQSDVFRKSLHTLQRLEEAVERQKRKRPRHFLLEAAKVVVPLMEAISRLAKAMSGPMKIVGVVQNGLVVQPRTAQGIAELGLVLLAQQKRVGRIRQCLNCGAWFYARFKHQHFCSNAEKRCQWNHYHSPEWRKQHRKSYLKDQQNYRDYWSKKRSK